MRKIILATHGYMAEGILSAAKMIMGSCVEIEAFGLEHYESPAEIAGLISRRIAAQPDCDFMIFCDIQGGSVYNQLTGLCSQPNVYLVGGVTLSMVLECYLNVQDIPTAELLEQVVQSAKDTITVLSHRQVKEQIEMGMEDDDLW